MIGLPTESERDLEEFVELLSKLIKEIKPIGQSRGRLTEMHISVNCFAPKPWTPFQFHPFGVSEKLPEETSVDSNTVTRGLKDKISFLKKRVSALPNVSMSTDNPDHVLFQAILARGDRRIGQLLMDMASSGMSWKRAMKQNGLAAVQFATRQYGKKSFLPWQIIDHSIDDAYLWQEYRKAFAGRQTIACDTATCRRCGVCND